MYKKRVIGWGPDHYLPHGGMWNLFAMHASVKIAGGTYDAGKTFGLVAYMHWLAARYAGSRMTFVHRSLNRVYRNIVPSYEKFLGYKPPSRDDPNASQFEVTRFGGERPEFFEYKNGTRIYMNGLDKPQNLLSDFFDAGFVNQAELVPFDAWDELTARVSERAGVMPIATLVGDCNPSVPHHWIRQQSKDKKLQYFKMSFLDNPEIVDQSDPEQIKAIKFAFENDPKSLSKYESLFSESGLRRVEKLKNLEGLRFKRGFLGEWASGEGLVFQKFDPEIHIVDTTVMPNWRRYLSVDWGTRNPSSVIWWARSPDDRLYAYKEIYKTQLTKPDLIRMIQENCDPREDKIQYAAVDSADQDGVEQLRRAGFRVQEPKKDRVAQIDAVKERLKVDASGQPALMFLRDRLVHPPDQDLKDDYRPVEVTDEFLSLSYNEKLKGTSKDDQDTVGDDHGTDGTAYLITSLRTKQSVGSGRVVHGSVRMRR